MSSATKDTIQKILLIALSAMTVSMVLISVFNYKDNRQKNEYLEKEKALVQEELTDIIRNYDHLGKQSANKSEEVNLEKAKARKLLENIRHTILDYETIIEYRKQMLELRKNNHVIQEKFDSGMSSNNMNTSY